jgi:hypothetical protein
MEALRQEIMSLNWMQKNSDTYDKWSAKAEINFGNGGIGRKIHTLRRTAAQFRHRARG